MIDVSDVVGLAEPHLRPSLTQASFQPWQSLEVKSRRHLLRPCHVPTPAPSRSGRRDGVCSGGSALPTSDPRLGAPSPRDFFLGRQEKGAVRLEVRPKKKSCHQGFE